jgi:hypothetical protein
MGTNADAKAANTAIFLFFVSSITTRYIMIMREHAKMFGMTFRANTVPVIYEKNARK